MVLYNYKKGSVCKMYTTNIDFEDFIGFTMESASRMFRKTEQYKLLKEKSDKYMRI